MPDNSVPERRLSRFRQFGLRTLLVLVALAAVGCLLARNEMVREERREKLIAELEKNGAKWMLFDPTLTTPPPRRWREPIGAWLRGKPMVPHRQAAFFKKGTPPQQIEEFLDLFSTIDYVEMDGDDVTTDILQSLASAGPFDGVRFRHPMAIDKETARRIALIPCKGGVLFEKQEFSDAELKNLADAGVRSFYSLHDDFWRNIGDEGLKAVAKSPVNDGVHAGCLGTDEGVRALEGNSSLSHLYLTGPNYTDASADVIPTLPGLGHLLFRGTGHTDAGLAKAIATCHAPDIAFHNVAVGDETIAALSNLQKLKTLSFIGIDLSVEQCDALAKLPIAQLTIHSRDFSDDKVARLAPLANSLSWFELNAPQVTDAGLAWLKDVNSLSLLHLNDTRATAATWSSLPYLERLPYIGMGGSNFNAETLGCVSGLNQIQGFILTGNEVDDAMLDLLPRVSETVTLVDTRVTPEGLKKLAQTKSLRAVIIRRASDAPPLITAADLKEVQAVVGPDVEIMYDEASMYKCD